MNNDKGSNKTDPANSSLDTLLENSGLVSRIRRDRLTRQSVEFGASAGAVIGFMIGAGYGIQTGDNETAPVFIKAFLGAAAGVGVGTITAPVIAYGAKTAFMPIAYAAKTAFKPIAYGAKTAFMPIYKQIMKYVSGQSE